MVVINLVLKQTINALLTKIVFVTAKILFLKIFFFSSIKLYTSFAMSEPSDSAPITPTVKKTARRFAPVKRGGSKTAAGIKREEAAAAAAAAAAASGEGGESSESKSTEAAPATEHVKSAPIGTMRPEGSSSGRLQSVNDGQKTRGGAAKVRKTRLLDIVIFITHYYSSLIDEI